MSEQTKKAQEQKDDTAGLGTLVGITALAALPFLRPVRNFVRQKLAKRNNRVPSRNKYTKSCSRRGTGCSTNNLFSR
jgi:hypothetical protein